jgi:hypothetical protein
MENVANRLIDRQLPDSPSIARITANSNDCPIHRQTAPFPVNRTIRRQPHDSPSIA